MVCLKFRQKLKGSNNYKCKLELDQIACPADDIDYKLLGSFQERSIIPRIFVSVLAKSVTIKFEVVLGPQLEENTFYLRIDCNDPNSILGKGLWFSHFESQQSCKNFDYHVNQIILSLKSQNNMM